MNAALETSGLGKRYRQRWALSECTIELPAGAAAAVVGPNGAGKSTLLNLVTGLLAPTTGTVRIFGRPLDIARVAFVAQDRPLYQRWSVADLLRFGAATNPRWDRRRAESLLLAHDIPPGQRVDRLSGGQRTLVALALAVGKQADLLVLDEPLAELDPLARVHVMEVVRTLEVTVLLSSHVLADLAQVCDHLILLGNGRVRLCGTFTELLNTHRAQTLEELVLGYLRSPELAR
ncbi:ABC transporter ATP-binding protein [Plantactinospora sonchi]|uniref:ABC transporter ATP-binding protein n=1 Tax=Plantactinospora sonchi TaxID=1544735 RepID=A0ABU7RMI3_9ACTN